MKKISAFLYLTFGWLSIVLAVIGIFLPVLPTTPFVLLAAWCFSRGSERCYNWLRNAHLFSKIIADWENGHCISRKTKWLASITMTVFIAYAAIFKISFWPLLVTIIIVNISVLRFIWSCPDTGSASKIQGVKVSE